MNQRHVNALILFGVIMNFLIVHQRINATRGVVAAQTELHQSALEHRTLLLEQHQSYNAVLNTIIDTLKNIQIIITGESPEEE